MSEPLRIGLAGLGTVGASVFRLVSERADELTRQCGRPVEIVAVSARDRARDRGVNVSDVTWFDDAVEMARSAEIDVFVELIGGAEGVAKEAVQTALGRGLHVVTANKALLAAHGVALAKVSEANGVLLNFEAAVAGGIPIIKTMRESLTVNKVSRIFGILNGTCNYILTRMDNEGAPFEDVLADAQRLGYAEADPTFDVDGFDTAHKLAILTTIAFGTEIASDDIYIEGIRNITSDDIKAARELGYRIKLLGVAVKTETGIEQRVHPTLVPNSWVLAKVPSVTNAVAMATDLLGEVMMTGPGAGGDATASAVLGDIADIAKSRPGFQHGPAFGRPATSLEPAVRAPMRAHAGGYFIRLTVRDEPGVVAIVAREMAERRISLESIVQHGGASDSDQTTKSIILVTHETTEDAVRSAVKAIQDESDAIRTLQVIRIERAA